jgi:hypothetical protein
MLVVPDIQDVYTPLQNHLIVPLSEGHEHLEQLLETIPSMFQNNRIQESAFGAAVKVNHNQGHPSDRSIMQTYCEDYLSIAMIL